MYGNGVRIGKEVIPMATKKIPQDLQMAHSELIVVVVGEVMLGSVAHQHVVLSPPMVNGTI